MSIAHTTDESSDTIVFPVDAEHGGIRAVVLASFIGGSAAGFLVTSMLIPSAGFNLLAILVGLLVGAGIALILERYLKGRWPSGRTIKVSASGVTIENKGKEERKMSAQVPAQTVLWRFEVQKRTRIPKGWLMYGCALEHDGDYLVAYTFAPPESLQTFPEAQRFKSLIGRKNRAGQQEIRDDMRLAGEQRRLRDAEGHRWVSGAEMTFADFQTYLSRIETQFPEWMPIK